MEQPSDTTSPTIHVPVLNKPVLSDRPEMEFFKSIFEASASEEEEEEEEEEKNKIIINEKRPMVCPDSSGVRFKPSVRSKTEKKISPVDKVVENSSNVLPPWALAALNRVSSKKKKSTLPSSH